MMKGLKLKKIICECKVKIHSKPSIGDKMPKILIIIMVYHFGFDNLYKYKSKLY